jgi:hypothetical protein
MARHPEWFERLDAILEVVRKAEIEWLGRREIQAIFGCSERDSNRLLHKLGAQERDNALSLPRSSVIAQLEAIRGGSTYAAYVRQRSGVAGHLAAARAEAAARQFRIRERGEEPRRRSFRDLPPAVTLVRPRSGSQGRLEIRYTDGADLMRQLADFLSVAGVNRDEFLDATEPHDDSAR